MISIQEIEPKCGEVLCRLFDLTEPNQTELNLNLQSIVAKSKQRHADLAHEIETRRHKSERNSRSRSNSRDATRSSKSPNNNSVTNTNNGTTNTKGTESNESDLSHRRDNNNRKEYYSRQQQHNSFRLAYQIILV